MVDILVAKLAEAVAACLMLYHSAGVERIAISAPRTEGYSRTILHIWQMPPYSVVLGTIIISVWFRLF